MEEESISLEDVLRGLRKRIKIIVVITIICTLVVGIVSFFIIEPKYKANTKLFIGKEGSELSTETEVNYNSSDIQMYEKIIQTYADVIGTKTLIDKALIRGNINLESDIVIKNLTVTPKTDTQILEMSYVSKDPEEAKNIVNLITEEFIDYSAKLIPNSNVQVVEDVYLPVKPVSPNKTLNLMIGLLVGIVLGILVALIQNYMDRTFSYKEEVENQIELPVLGDIPDLNTVQ